MAKFVRRRQAPLPGQTVVPNAVLDKKEASVVKPEPKKEVKPVSVKVAPKSEAKPLVKPEPQKKEELNV